MAKELEEGDEFEEGNELEEEEEDKSDEEETESETEEDGKIEEPTEEIKELTTESLEEITEQPSQPTEADDFSEFMVSSEAPVSEEMPSPTLPSAPFSPAPEPAELPAENLEGIGAASSIGTPLPTLIPEAEPDYITTYNEPEYLAGTSEENILKGMGERQMMGRTAEELRGIHQRATIEEWHEIEEARDRARPAVEDYVIVEAGKREDQERRLPFEQQRKYRGVKRGK